MKINRLKIVNFRNHSSTDLDMTKKVNLFVGPNASGKSSVVDALAFLLTGTNVRTAKSGEGMNEVVTFGESRALVAADITGVGKVTRTIPHSFQVADWEGTMSAQVEQMYGKLGVTKNGLLCSIYSSNFLDMTPDEQKNFMFQLMGLQLTNDVVEKEFEVFCKQTNISNYKELWGFIAKDFTFDGNPTKFDEVYQAYAERRKILKKDIKKFDTLAKEIKTVLPEGITIDHRDSVLSKLNELRCKRDELMVSLGNARSLVRLKEELEKIVATENSIAIPVKTQEELRKDIEVNKEAYSKYNRGLAKHNSEIKQLEDTVAKLGHFTGKCPLSEAIDCKIAKDEVQMLIDKFNLKIKDIQAKRDEDEKVYDTIQETMGNLGHLLEARVKADIMLPTVEKAKKDLADMKSKQLPDMETIGKDIRVLDERITKGQSILTAIEAEITNDKRRVEATREFDKKTSELELIETVIEAFGAKGLKSIILNKAIKPLEERANQKLSVLTNNRYSINFRIDEEDFNIYIISEGMERRVKHLSSSERLRIGVIMQDAINSLVGSKFMVVDDVDILDNDNRKLFWDLIGNIKANYDTLVILATGTEIKESGTDDTNTFLFGRKKKEDGLF